MHIDIRIIVLYISYNLYFSLLSYSIRIEVEETDKHTQALLTMNYSKTLTMVYTLTDLDLKIVPLLRTVRTVFVDNTYHRHFGVESGRLSPFLINDSLSIYLHHRSLASRMGP